MDPSKKAKEINAVLSEPKVNLWKLRELALSDGGLVNDTLRKRAWPKLVGLHDYYSENTNTSTNTNTNTSHNRTKAPRVLGTAAAAVASPARNKVQNRVHILGLPPRHNPSSSLLTNNTNRNNRNNPSKIADVNNYNNNSNNSNNSNNNNTAHYNDEISTDASSTFTSDHHHHRDTTTTTAARLTAPNVPPSHDADQIDRDVARCTWHLLTGNQRSRRHQMKNKHRKKVASVLKKKQRRLGSLINLTLLKNYQEVLHHDRLQYYQGYHDVASIFLSALGGGGGGGGGGPSQNTKETTESLEAIAGSLGLDLPAQVLGQLSKSHFRDALQSNFTQLQTALRLVLMPLIWYFDVDVHDHLADCGMEPVFAVSWIITWFSHDVRDTDLVKRLFDAFLVSHPLLPVYMTVAMVCHPYNRLEILSTECDFSLLHQTLAGLPKNSSMVGWKYQVGDGYVSGDEVDDATATTDIGTATTDMDVSLLSEDLMDRELEFREEEFQSMQSPIAGPLTVGSKAPKAPFQELIDTALSFMRRMPPKSLTDLSTRYYSDEFLGPMMALAPSIVLLQSPPVWSIQNSCTADWVLKERRTGKQLSRRDRRRYGVRSPSPSSRSRKAKSLRSTETTNQLKHQTQQTSSSSIEELSPEVYVEKMSGTLPVIACGLGAGDDEIARKKRKRRKRMIVAGAVFAALTISCISVAVINGRSVTPAIMPTPKNTQHKIVTASDKVPKRERPQQTQKTAKRATPSVGKSQTKSQRTAATTQHRGVTEKRTGETKIPSMPKRSPPPKEVKKAPLISRPNPPLKQTSSPAVRGKASPERPPLPARAQNMVAPRTTVAVPSEKSETKMGVHQVKYATRSAKMKEVTRTVGTFITEAREVNTWTLEETVQILTNDFFVPGYQKVVVPAMHKLKGDVWTTAKESVLLPAHRKMTNEILPAVRNEVQSVIIPGTMHLFENNVYYPLKSQLSNARDALFIGARIARFALVEGRRELRNFVREAGEALKEDDFVL